MDTIMLVIKDMTGNCTIKGFEKAIILQHFSHGVTLPLTGDAANADPVCDLSPHHHLVTEMVDKASAPDAPAPVVEHPLIFRDRKNSRALSG